MLLRPLAVGRACVFGCAGDRQTKWDMPTGYPIGNPHTVTLNAVCQGRRVATNGKLKIAVHANGSLFKAPEIMRAVESGQAQIGEILMSVLANQNPVFAPIRCLSWRPASMTHGKLYQAQRPVLDRTSTSAGEAAVCRRVAAAGDLRKEGAALGRRHEGT